MGGHFREGGPARMGEAWETWNQRLAIFNGLEKSFYRFVYSSLHPPRVARDFVKISEIQRRESERARGSRCFINPAASRQLE